MDQGRATLNFSAWGTGQQQGGDVVSPVRDGSMPPVYYVWLHPAANLSAPERQALLHGLTATFGPAAP